MAAVPLERVDAAVTELAGAARTVDPFVLRLSGAGAFPRTRRAGVVWAGAIGASLDDAHALAQLAKHVRIGLRSARLRPDRAPFRPHVTVARVRPATDVGPLLLHLASETAADDSPLWQVNGVQFVESRLGAMPDGTPSYRSVATLALGR